jgi:agmatinase
LSGRITTLRDPLPVVDTGDATIVHHDVAGQVAAIVDHVRACSLSSGLTVSLGGDHFVAYPCARGVVEAWRERRADLRVGYLQVDAHTDFLDERLGSGRFSHATMARRISELPEVRRMVWLGLSSSSEPEQFNTMQARGFHGLTAAYVRSVGATAAMERALSEVCDGTDVVYVSLDIDAANNSDAPGTGSYVHEGISAADYLDFARGLAKVDTLAGLDLCEVAPSLPEDGGWRTALLAAQLLVTALGSRVVDEVGSVPLDRLREVFPAPVVP